MIQSDKNIVGPGAFRFILASMVVFFHTTSFIFFGRSSVYAFFILSGYWVTKVYIEKYKSKDNYLSKFYLSRALKIYPVYYVVSLIAILFNVAFAVPNNVFLFNVFNYFGSLGFLHKVLFVFTNISLFGYNLTNFKLIYTAWSLDIEIQFYLVLPLLVLLIQRFSLKIIMGTSLLITVLLAFKSVLFLNDTVLFYGFFFLIGIYMYQSQISVSKRTVDISLLICFLLIAIQYCFPELRKITMHNNESAYCSVVNLVIPLTLVPFIISNVKIKSNSTDRFLGDISYVVYLLHPLLIIPYSIASKNQTLPHKMLFFLVYIVVMSVLSYLLHQYADKKFNVFRQRIIDRQNNRFIIKENKI